MKTRRILSIINLRTLIVGVCVLLMSGVATAQETLYKFDFGAQVGMSGYIGDANSSNLMSHPGLVGELTFRYLPNTRWAVRTMLTALTLSGNSDNMANVLPEDVRYTFKTAVAELGCRGEFNFFPYGVGESYKKIRRWTPYLTLGIGVAMARTAGHTYVSPTIPIGAGIKFKLRERINLGMEFTMTKTFNDHFDGPDLADLNQIKTAFYKNTDWYSRLCIGISYEFGKRCRTCHYVD